jgi:hypothetical protein
MTRAVIAIDTKRLLIAIAIAILAPAPLAVLEMAFRLAIGWEQMPGVIPRAIGFSDGYALAFWSWWSHEPRSPRTPRRLARLGSDSRWRARLRVAAPRNRNGRKSVTFLMALLIFACALNAACCIAHVWMGHAGAAALTGACAGALAEYALARGWHQ